LNHLLDIFRVPLRRQVVLTSFPDFDDQTLSVAVEAHRRGIDVVVVASQPQAPQHWRDAGVPDMVCVRRGWRALWTTKSSQWVCFTHGFLWAQDARADQLVVNLWHGIPFKKVGSEIDRPMPKSDYVLASSPLTTELVERMYPAGAAPTVLAIGLPRNDLLLKSARTEVGSGRRIAWLPTYRQSDIGEIRNDGLIEDTGLGMSLDQLGELDEGLAALDFKVTLKPHPMTELALPRGLHAIEMWVDDGEESSLYSRLGEFDALLTDYSSVALDFAIAGRPVFLLACDRTLYAATRGLFADVGDLLGIPEASTPGELLAMLAAPDWYSNCVDARQWHANVDTPAAAQLWDLLTSNK
jgi:CDP-glycerol glycerophosphotransferase (TagB/SpsB family)